jgi:hypothetical protein
MFIYAEKRMTHLDSKEKQVVTIPRRPIMTHDFFKECWKLKSVARLGHKKCISLIDRKFDKDNKLHKKANREL